MNKEEIKMLKNKIEATKDLGHPWARKIMELRLQGKRLEEVGREFDVTRERIRQIEAKALEIINNK